MKSTKGILIQFNGSAVTRRIVGDYEWHDGNGFQCTVPVELAAELILSPGDQFTAVPQKVSKTTVAKLSKLTGLDPADFAAVFAPEEGE